MKPRLHPPSAVLAFTVILAIVVCFPVISCKKMRPYDICGESVQCGDIPIQYPFWGSDRPAYCGHPGFELTCASNVPILTYQSLYYRVLDINNSTQIVKIARNDLWTDYCRPFLNATSFNTTLFNLVKSGQENLSLYYHCNATTAKIPSVVHYIFHCDVTNRDLGTYGFCIRTNQINSDVTNMGCEENIVVPVSQSLAGRLDFPTSTEADLRSALMAGFNLRWMAKKDECDRCIRSNGRCGSNPTSPELFACYCDTGNFSLTCNNLGESGGSNRAVWKLIIIGCSCFLAIIMILLCVILRQRKKLLETQNLANQQIETFIRNQETLSPKRYKYSEIKKITNCFVEKLGQGGYGSVYKGQLPSGRLVAVKILDRVTGNGEDFINEVGSIGRTSHVNIVALLGFSFEGNKRALVYEFMPNGSLDKFLRGDGSHLDWPTLFRIAKGIARGLEYLHRGCTTSIVHFDIKPHNILLDEDFIPKISDFGLAKLSKSKESIVSVTGARGTAGYMAPEVFFRSLGGASHKSDVYSYGMMVLEMTGTCKDNIASTTEVSATYFPDTIYKKVEAEENLGVQGVTSKEEEELTRKMVMVSLWCIQSDPSDRPSISKVVEMLEGSIQSLKVPPKRFWSSPPRSSQGITPLSTEGCRDERLLTM